MTDMQWRPRRAAGHLASGRDEDRQVWGWPAGSRTDRPGELGLGGRSASGTDVLDVPTPGSFSEPAARGAQPGGPWLLAWVGSETAARLDHLLDGHRVFLPYLMAGHFPSSSGDASPSVKLMALPLLRSPFTGGVCVAVRVLDPWREFGVWVDPAHLAHRDCAVCTPVWARRAGEFDTAQADLAATVASGGEEYVPLLFALANVYPDPPVVIGPPTTIPTAPSTLDGSVRGAAWVEVATILGWTRPRVIVHVSDITGIGDMGGRGR